MPGRRILYEKRRRWFFWGNDTEQPVKYNRLQSHTDLVRSFLFSADHLDYAVTYPGKVGQIEESQGEAFAEYLSSTIRTSAIVHQFADALLWALIYDSMFLKMGWSDTRDCLTCKIIDPHSIGVWDEGEGEFSDQIAFCHTYALPWRNAAERLIRAGRKRDIKRLGVDDTSRDQTFPPVMNSILISSTGSGVGGPLIGNARTDVEQYPTYRSESHFPQVKFTELWVWDDEAKDYCSFTMADPDIVVSDSRETIRAMAALTPAKYASWGESTNIFLPGEHPFVPITPYPIYDYFWGEAHTERLIPLQRWTTQRLDQIADKLDQDSDPSKVFSGFTGLSDEKAANFGGPGAWIEDQNPSAKAELLRPDIPPELFAEFNEIGKLFNEASGLTETIMGQGSQNVRSKDQAKQLAVTGSGRIRKTALGLEASLSRLGDLASKLIARNDDTTLETSQGFPFLAGQMAPDFVTAVSGHSHSPLFASDTKELAALLFKASAIDKEALLRLMRPPNVEHLVKKLREMEKRQALQGQGAPGTKEQAERQRSHHHPKGDLKGPGGGQSELG